MVFLGLVVFTRSKQDITQSFVTAKTIGMMSMPVEIDRRRDDDVWPCRWVTLSLSRTRDPKGERSASLDPCPSFDRYFCFRDLIRAAV